MREIDSPNAPCYSKADLTQHCTSELARINYADPSERQRT